MELIGRPVFLPLLFRLYQPKRSPSKPELARAMAGTFAAATRPRAVHLVADAAYRSKVMAEPASRVELHHPAGGQRRLYAPAPRRDRVSAKLQGHQPAFH